MAGSCPTIDFGVPEEGAKEYNMNSGRELFRCGLQCIKMYITNVTMEVNTVKYSCATIDDAGHEKFCLKSAQISKRDQGIVNWIAKSGASSAWDTGCVLTKADLCLASTDNDPMVYTHTEGNLSVRVTINITDVADSRDDIKDAALAKFNSDSEINAEFQGMEWILSDVGTNASPTDWQGGSVTYQGFANQHYGHRTARASFNWDNGRIEKSVGDIRYDITDDCNIGNVVNSLIS